MNNVLEKFQRTKGRRGNKQTREIKCESEGVIGRESEGIKH